MATEQGLLTRREAAKLAKVSYNGIRFWEKHGRLDPVRVMNGGVEEVRIPRAQVEAIIRERRENMTEDESAEVENRMLRDELERERAEKAALQERYDRLLEKLLEITHPSK